MFQEHLRHLQKPERHAALDTLKKIRQLTWAQLYRENDLKWEKIVRLKSPHGMGATYWARIIQCRRCAAFRDREYMRLLTIAPVHDSTYRRN